MNKSNFKGFSLIETLVVLGLFAVVGVVTTASLFTVLRSARKTDAIGRVKSNLDYAVSIMERQIRNANSISTSGGCFAPIPTPNEIDFTDSDNNPNKFSCQGLPTGFVASGSANIRVTSAQVNITNCSITCFAGASGSVPPYVNFTLTGVDAGTSGVEGATATVSNKVYLRTYGN